MGRGLGTSTARRGLQWARVILGGLHPVVLSTWVLREEEQGGSGVMSCPFSAPTCLCVHLSIHPSVHPQGSGDPARRHPPPGRGSGPPWWPPGR